MFLEMCPTDVCVHINMKVYKVIYCGIDCCKKDQHKTISINKTQAKYIMVHSYNAIIGICGVGEEGETFYILKC